LIYIHNFEINSDIFPGITSENRINQPIGLISSGWGQDNPAFRQVFTSLMVPGGTPEQMDWFNDLQRNTTTPENAIRIRHTQHIREHRYLLM
jgi:hypothetical protein